MSKFLENHNLAKLLLEEIENVNNPVTKWLYWQIPSDTWGINNTNLFETPPENRKTENTCKLFF